MIDDAVALHRDRTEHALARVSSDDSLDDREKGRRITQVIAAANARMVELVGQRTDSTGSTWLPDREPVVISQRRIAI